MARTVFDSRSARPESGGVHQLRLDADRGARMGEYTTTEPAEYTDSYYGPADDFDRRQFGSRGYERGNYGRSPRTSPAVGGITREGGTARPTDRGSYGDVHPGERSWAQLGVSSTRAGDQGRADRAATHKGRGPKGYKRSDERLSEVICELLADDPHVDASHVHVEVQGGVVTLRGHVGDRWTKYQIEELIDQCVGVNDIVNHLKISRSDELLPRND